MNISKSQEIDTDLIKTQADAILYFLQNMDIEMVDDILDDSCTYQGFKKHVFIQKLGNAFNQFAASGDSFLQCYQGFCKSNLCGYRCGGFSFIGNHSNNYMDLIIKVENGRIIDMYECSSFKNQDHQLTKKQRIVIHKIILGL